MILSGKEITRQVELGVIRIDPFNPAQVNPNSYNLRLADDLFRYRSTELDFKRQEELERVPFDENGALLDPGTLYLGRTVERTATREFVPMIEGRSSVGRLGVFIHVTAGFGDVGFDGFWTLEIACVQPVRIYPGTEICQIFYHAISGEKTFYATDAKYNHNDGVQPSLIYREF